MGFLDKLRPEASHQNVPDPSRTVKDPVCGMRIKAASAAGQVEHAGQTVYFCSASCKSRFVAAPANYVST